MRNLRNQNIWFIIVLFSVLLFSCDHKFSSSLFKGKSAHERYEKQIRDAGLDGSVLFDKWLNAAERSLQTPFNIQVPYQEKAYFSSEHPNAMGYSFEARNGEQLEIELSYQSLDSTRLFIDLFEMNHDSTQKPKHLHAAEADSSFLQYVIKDDGQYILRIQPELLSDISFDLRITAEPSLSNPIAANANQNIKSFFGMERDAGERTHEGIDIFADRLTPVVAAADGIISRVGTNDLGGKVVSLRPKGRSISLYYAHLERQSVTTGQSVTVGDTIGFVGNTGNARTTPPHLHFGIYTPTGAIDPLPFVKPGKSSPSSITADAKRLGDTVRMLLKDKEIQNNTPLFIEAVALNGYRAMLPNKSKVFILESQVVTVSKSLKTIALDRVTPVYSEPNARAAKITEYPIGKTVQVVGDFDQFRFVKSDAINGWIAK